MASCNPTRLEGVTTVTLCDVIQRKETKGVKPGIFEQCKTAGGVEGGRCSMGRGEG